MLNPKPTNIRTIPSGGLGTIVRSLLAAFEHRWPDAYGMIRRKLFGNPRFYMKRETIGHNRRRRPVSNRHRHRDTFHH